MIPHADWLLAGLGLASCWLMGSKRRSAWVLAILTNVAGMAYFAGTGQDGLVALDCAFLAINLRGYWRWEPEAQRPTLAELLEPYRPAPFARHNTRR